MGVSKLAARLPIGLVELRPQRLVLGRFLEALSVQADCLQGFVPVLPRLKAGTVEAAVKIVKQGMRLVGDCGQCRDGFAVEQPVAAEAARGPPL